MEAGGAKLQAAELYGPDENLAKKSKATVGHG